MNARHTNLRTRRSAVTRAVGTVLESMEQRRLMSGTLTITPNSGNDSITIDVTAAGGVRKLINGVTTNYPPGQWSDITINATGDNEQLTIRGSVVPIDIYSV